MVPASLEDRLKALKETNIPTDDLVPIAELVQSVMQREKLRRFEAAGLVLDSLVGHAAVVIYFAPEGQPPFVVDRGDLYPDPGYSPGRWSSGGISGVASTRPLHPKVEVLQWLRIVFSSPNSPWDYQRADCFCILKADAVALQLMPPAEVTDGIEDQPAEKTKVVQPSGGCWPHQPGSWSEAEKEALRLMRANDLTDVAIAKIAGCKRQAIDQQIGSKTKNKVDANARMRLVGKS